MSKEKSEALEVLTKDQAESLDRIKVYHVASLKAVGDHFVYVALAGFELNCIKGGLGHGKFMAWREAHLVEIPHRTATRYMEFAAKVEEKTKLATVANLPTKLLTNGELPLEAREQITKAVHKIADGKTLTQLYRDLGIIRDKEHQKHTPAKEPTAEEALAAKLEAAKAIFARAHEALQLIREFDAETLGIIPREGWADHLSACVQSTKHARPIVRGFKKAKGKKK